MSFYITYSNSENDYNLARAYISPQVIPIKRRNIIDGLAKSEILLFSEHLNFASYNGRSEQRLVPQCEILGTVQGCQIKPPKVTIFEFKV